MKRIIPKLGRIRDPETGKLVPGVIARDPRTLERLPVDGILVDYVDAFWLRREAEGGVTIVDEPAPDLAAPAPPPELLEPAATNAPPAAADSVTPSKPAPAPAPKE